MSITTEVAFYDDLTEEEREGQPDNGSGADCASYLRVYHNGELIDTYSDAMEPEDITFYRDLSWISAALQDAYERGKADATA